MKESLLHVIVTPLLFAGGEKQSGSRLQDDPALGVAITIVEVNPPLPEVLMRLQKATKLKFTIGSAIADHAPELGGFSFRDAPAWIIMRVVAQVQLEGGKWQKIEGGYMLTATRALIAQKKEEKPAQAKSGSADRKSPIFTDPRLTKKVNVDGENVELTTMLDTLKQATGVSISVAENLQNHEPNYGSVQLGSAPAWMVMEMVARHQMENGRWEKVDDGYCLVGTSLAPKAAPAKRNWPVIPAIIVVIAIGGLIGVYFLHKRSRGFRLV